MTHEIILFDTVRGHHIKERAPKASIAAIKAYKRYLKMANPGNDIAAEIDKMPDQKILQTLKVTNIDDEYYSEYINITDNIATEKIVVRVDFNENPAVVPIGYVKVAY